MFKINRKVEYALIALKHMNNKKNDALTSAKEICERYRTPFDPTSRVLQIMAQSAILRAEQGAHGGYSIVKDLSTVTIKDLTDSIIGPIKIANCLSGDYSCCEMVECCSVIAPMLTLNEKIADLFSTITIEELINSTNADERLIRNKPLERAASSRAAS